MKKFISLLLPVVGLTTISSCTCAIGGNEPQPISKDYLDIRGNILYGFKDQYKKHVDFPQSSYELIIPKEVTAIDEFAFSVDGEVDAGIVITKISYEQDCACTTMGSSSFMGCTNLTSVAIPPLVSSLEGPIFNNCASLTSIDICGLTNLSLTGWLAPTGEYWSKTGTVVYDNNEALATKLAEYINAATGQAGGWTIQHKESI